MKTKKEIIEQRDWSKKETKRLENKGHVGSTKYIRVEAQKEILDWVLDEMS